MRIKLYALVGLAAIITLALTANLRSAQAADIPSEQSIISVSPSFERIEAELQPGETYNRTLQITNTSEQNHSVKVTPATFWVDEAIENDYSIVTGVSESQFGKIASWTNLDINKIYDIAAGQTYYLNYTIAVPSDAAGGAQRLTLQVNIGGRRESGFVAMETILNAQIYATVSGATNPQAEVVAQSISGFTAFPHISATSSIQNTGNVDLTAQYILKVTDFFTGALAYSNEEIASTNAKVLMTDTTRIYEQQWESAPQLGIFRVTQDVILLGETHSISKVVVICPIWLMLLVAAFIVAIVIFFVSKSRARRRDNRHDR